MIHLDEDRFKALVREAVREEIAEQLRELHDQVLTTREAAELLRCSEDTVLALAASHTIPGVTYGRGWKFSKTTLLAWVRAQGQ